MDFERSLAADKVWTSRTAEVTVLVVGYNAVSVTFLMAGGDRVTWPIGDFTSTFRPTT